MDAACQLRLPARWPFNRAARASCRRPPRYEVTLPFCAFERQTVVPTRASGSLNRPHLPLAALGATLIFAAGAMAWSQYYPRSQLIRAASLAGERGSDADRECGLLRRQTAIGAIPLRTGTCSRVRREHEYWHREMITFDGLTRRVTAVHRTWPLPDSMSWVSARDSVAAQLDGSGGRRIECDAGRRMEHILYKQHWRFDGYDVRLIAYGWIPPNPARLWLLQVDATPGVAPECALGASRALSSRASFEPERRQ
ncbi:hypothetical protein BH23GEM2_BH23GEM2_23170 [soil metagenome]